VFADARRIEERKGNHVKGIRRRDRCQNGGKKRETSYFGGQPRGNRRPSLPSVMKSWVAEKTRSEATGGYITAALSFHAGEHLPDQPLDSCKE